jgi:murein DD-endopeptidase MepM/ murein hydrolase activator NlpD
VLKIILKGGFIMKYKETKISKFLNGKGFYLVLAGCLIATGIAAWTALAGVSGPGTAETPNSSMNQSSTPAPEIDQVQQNTSDQPYDDEEKSSENKETIVDEPVVAENFIYPLSGSTLKAYSDDELIFSKTFGDMRLHIGLDIEGEKGQAVKACGNGIVTKIATDTFLGKYVEVDHGNGIVARYCGLAENLSVTEGNIVSAGTKLGLLADVPCECEDETHLHLEFYKDEYPVDPVAIIEG